MWLLRMKKEHEGNITVLEKKKLQRTRDRKEERNLKVFYIYLPSPCTAKTPQNENTTESSWEPEVYCNSEVLICTF